MLTMDVVGLDGGDRRRPDPARRRQGGRDLVRRTSLPAGVQGRRWSRSPPTPRLVVAPTDRPGPGPRRPSTTCSADGRHGPRRRDRHCRSRRPRIAPARLDRRQARRRLAPSDLGRRRPTPSGVARRRSAGHGRQGTPVVATVLLSDGANSTGRAWSRSPPPTGRGAAGVPIYTIALGTPDGIVHVQDQFGQTPDAQCPAGHRDARRRSRRRPVASSSTLRRAEDLAAIYQSLGSKVGLHDRGAGGDPVVRRRRASLLVIAGAGLAALWFNRFP